MPDRARNPEVPMLPFCLALLLVQAPEAPPPGVAATVNGEAVPAATLEAMVQRHATSYGPASARQLREIRRECLDQLVEEALLRQYLRQHAPKVEAAETDKLFQGLSDGLRKRGKTLADYCREVGLTEAEVREAWVTLIQLGKYVEGRVTDAELRKYHEQHRAYFDQSTATVGHIVTRAGTPAERAEARSKMMALRADIAAGKVSFADAARKYSVDRTAPAGGALGTVTARDPLVEPAVARAAFTLPVGQVGEPVESEVGVHLVLVSDRKAGKPSDLAAVKDWVLEAYTDELRQSLVAQLKSQAKVVRSAEQAAK